MLLKYQPVVYQGGNINNLLCKEIITEQELEDSAVRRIKIYDYRPVTRESVTNPKRTKRIKRESHGAE